MFIFARRKGLPRIFRLLRILSFNMPQEGRGVRRKLQSPMISFHRM
jgi:hypothetical protein